MDTIETTIKKAEKCNHYFKLEKTDIESLPSNSTAAVNYFYKKIAYVVCKKCGLILKQDI